jgi:hypothetical protein
MSKLLRVGGVVLLLALAACGSSKSASTATTAANPVADRATAGSLTLVQADFPTGWTGTTHQTDPSDAAITKRLATCAGATGPATRTADVNGDDFGQGNAQVSSEVTIEATRADFVIDAAALRSSKYESCLKDLFSTELQKQLTKSSPGVTVSGLAISKTPTPTYGEVTVAVHVTVTVTGPTGKTIKVYSDNVSYGKGRTEVDLTFTNTGAPFDAAVEHSLVTKAAAKLKAAS